ncbi:MAG: retropepsin-like aspartic protease [Novosphingobium sp.]
MIAPSASQQVGAAQPVASDRTGGMSAFEVRTPEPEPEPDSGFGPTQAHSVDGTVESNSASDGLFYVTAMVNGKPVRFVVDTGASVVVLTRSDAIKAGVTRGAKAVDVETAGGSSAMHSVNLKRVDIAGQALTDVDAAIMGAELPVSLLGQSVLSQMRSVRLTGNRLQLN